MTTTIPLKLYKYQSLAGDSHTLENFRKHQLFFPKPVLLNDPYDFSISFRLLEATDKQWNKAYKKMRDKLKKEGNFVAVKEADRTFLTDGLLNQIFKDQVIKVNVDNIENRRKKYKDNGVACFTVDFVNFLMWSHYADGHRGLCLEFDTKYLPFNNPQKLKRVFYRNVQPVLNPVEFLIKGFVETTPFTTKSTKWKYEQEWRLITRNGNSAIEYEPRALTGIYFGCSMLEDQKRKIATMPANSAASLYQMKLSATKFELVYEPFRLK